MPLETSNAFGAVAKAESEPTGAIAWDKSADLIFRRRSGKAKNLLSRAAESFRHENKSDRNNNNHSTYFYLVWKLKAVKSNGAVIYKKTLKIYTKIPLSSVLVLEVVSRFVLDNSDWLSYCRTAVLGAVRVSMRAYSLIISEQREVNQTYITRKRIERAITKSPLLATMLVNQPRDTPANIAKPESERRITPLTCDALWCSELDKLTRWVNSAGWKLGSLCCCFKPNNWLTSGTINLCLKIKARIKLWRPKSLWRDEAEEPWNQIAEWLDYKSLPIRAYNRFLKWGSLLFSMWFANCLWAVSKQFSAFKSSILNRKKIMEGFWSWRHV